MLIFSNDDIYYIFIHIPKNSGTYMRKKILADKNNKIIKSYWNIESGLDLAHIPYIKKDNFIENNEYKYFTYTRNPYDRIISGFFYKNPKKNVHDFRFFIKEILVLYNFSMNFDFNIIHYYPQYLFVCDNDFNIEKNIEINKLENVENPKKYILENFFDNECIKIINNIYINDFLLFDYKLLDV